MGVGECTEAAGCSAKPVAQGLGHEGCLYIEPISMLPCCLRVAVGADRVAAAELAGELVGCRRPGIRIAQGRVSLEGADEERVRVVEEDEAITREELNGGLRGGQGAFEAGDRGRSDNCPPRRRAGDLFTAEQVRSLPDALRDLTARLAPHLVVEFGSPSGVDAEGAPVAGGGVEPGRRAS
ncbi:hypothetical protein Sfulv_50420 [Streptomyces fulvorobeus]|uniref:Uncharacterized protein n=1 Tax=Streptomyces fulvorobeus TaxID=284028 RepID=A0A7J0CCI8_9ACTN|nr:hypothetical protein Sfulv_50420 [Streptomyces fulvorobeus]